MEGDKLLIFFQISSVYNIQKGTFPNQDFS